MTLSTLVVFAALALALYPWLIHMLWLPTCSRLDAFSSTLCTVSNFSTCTWPGQHLLFGDCKAAEDAGPETQVDLADYMDLLAVQKLWVSTMANHTLTHVDVAFDLHTIAHHVNASLQELAKAYVPKANRALVDDVFSLRKASAFLDDLQRLAQEAITIHDEVAFVLEAFVPQIT